MSYTNGLWFVDREPLMLQSHCNVSANTCANDGQPGFGTTFKVATFIALSSLPVPGRRNTEPVIAFNDSD